jgi:hypothetical protein
MFRKHSDEIPELTLPKWPFILGDLLLVATALAIAILGNWQLTDWQVLACVLAVALGAALFVLPFIVEFWAREQEKSSLTKPQDTALNEQVEELKARTAVMADQLTRLAKAQAEAPKVPSAPAFDTAALKALEERLDQQAKQLKATEKSLREIKTAPAPISDSKPAPESKPLAKPPAKPKAKPIAEPAKTPENPLLKRAIHEKQDRATQAVDRIIEAKPEAKIPKPEPKLEKEPQPEKTEAAQAKTQPEPLKIPEPKKETPTTIQPKPEPKTELKVELKAEVKPEPKPPLVLPEPKAALAPKPEAKPAPKPVKEAEPASVAIETLQPAPQAPAPAKTKKPTPAAPDPTPAAEPKAEAEPAPSLFGTDEVPAAPAKRRAKKNETRCTINTLIGIGNKPYLRGSGGGLNWESGVVLEFEAIGKWRWIVPTDLDGPIEVQVYRNDEDPDTSGKHTLQPGEPLEINAQF